MPCARERTSSAWSPQRHGAPPGASPRADPAPATRRSRCVDHLRGGPRAEIVTGERCQAVDGERMAEEESLDDVAAEGPQRLHLAVGLDALGHTKEPEGVGHADDGLHDGRVLLVLTEAVHEAPVDLDR